MVVDDSASIRQVVSIAFKDAGYDVIQGVDGKDALSKMDGRKIHLVVSNAQCTQRLLDMVKVSNKLLLMPGDLIFGQSVGVLSTLLGSCVAITLWHPVKKIAGMCHFMLPSRPRGSSDKLSGRYGDEAIKIFLSEIARHGCRPEDFEVKVFGAGTMVQHETYRCESIHSISISCKNDCRNIACKNRDAALNLLSKHGFQVSYTDLGGGHPRNIMLDTANGQVSVKGEPASATNTAHVPLCIGELTQFKAVQGNRA